MARHRFSKMHGLGNDFVIFDARGSDLSLTGEQAARLAHRQHGIGCDQLIVMRDADDADIAMQIFNNDGSEVAACGNATRCVVSLAGRDVTIRTAAGLLSGRMGAEEIAVDMGEPRFDWDAIPLAYAMDTANMPVAWDGLTDPAAVNMGNPHIVFFVDDAEQAPLETMGPEIEHDPLFPERVNVNIASIRDGAIHLRVWERGAGATLACGTGACATAVTAIRRRLVASPVAVHLPGGRLTIDWAPGRTVTMSGPVTHVFDGEIDL